MTTRVPPTPPDAKPPSKLVIRGKVLTAIAQLSSQKGLSTSDHLRLLQRLESLGDIATVQEVLVKELSRAHGPEDRQRLDTIADTLTKIGRLGDVQELLWQLIADPEQVDIVKDTANLVLRQLGDRSEPEKYMQFLQDPEELIHQEMARTLEMSMSDPQALVDFVDFIVSLNAENQTQLLDTLQTDFDPKARAILYQCMLETLPNEKLAIRLIHDLGETGAPDAAAMLLRLKSWPEEKLPAPMRSIDVALKKLQLAGVYHPEQGVIGLNTSESHPLAKSSDIEYCYTTLPDGLGNQGLLLSRRHQDGSYCLIGIAIHDVYGVVDSFGFHELSAQDVQRFIERFYESGLKTPIHPGYMAHKVKIAEGKTLAAQHRLPYEYRAWAVLLSDIPEQAIDFKTESQQWATAEWQENTHQLYQHPEFRHWFSELGDISLANECFQQVQNILRDMENPQHALSQLDACATQLALILQNQTDWVERMAARLDESAWLLDQQHVETFRNLAATAAQSLHTLVKNPSDHILPFTRAYARKSIFESVLRFYKTLPKTDRELEKLIPKIKKSFDI